MFDPAYSLKKSEKMARITWINFQEYFPTLFIESGRRLARATFVCYRP
jgi:hypothetical protein